MPINIPNPYSGQEDQTCSTSFAAQQQMAGSVGSPQTEAQYNQSKLLGEIGVMKAKLAKGEIPDGTKLLTFKSKATGTRGYYFVKGGQVKERSYKADGTIGTSAGYANTSHLDYLAANDTYEVAIPQAVASNPKPEPNPLKLADKDYLKAVKEKGGHDIWVAKTADGQYGVKLSSLEGFLVMQKTEYGYTPVQTTKGAYLAHAHMNATTTSPFYQTDHDGNIPTATPPPAPTQVAAPTPVAPVNAGSASVGSMSHEDVSAMFVKIKDDLAKAMGVNIKGANSDLDAAVYKAIGGKTGYTPEEVKAKIDAYKAAGNKLSALKKKVLAGTKKVPEGSPQSAPAAPKPLVPTPGVPKPDPKPNGVPTVATPSVTNAAKQEVKEAVEADPGKLYSDEDVAGAYIIAKDQVVSASNGKYTLYSKSDEMDELIYKAVNAKTGFNPLKAKQAIANYLASGKKLSTLKKQLAKQGAFKPQADTLKKSGAAKTQAEKDAEVAAKAAAGYTPVGTPTTGTPPTDTGKPMPVAPAKAARSSGDIGDIAEDLKAQTYQEFKLLGSYSYLSSSNETTYDGLVKLQAKMAGKGHEFSLLQLLRIVDEQGAKKFGKPNENLFEKKTASWLTSSEGTKYIKANEAKALFEAQKAKKAAEIAKAAKLLEANQPALPADSAQYEPWDLDKAKRISETWLDAKPWTDKERRDLKHYTGSSYTEMNRYLRAGRSGAISARSKSAINGAAAGMRPTTEPIMVRRGTGLAQFSSLGLGQGDKNLVWGLAGKSFTDEGFLSTSAGGRAAFGGEAKLEIECPVGTPMAYVAPISNFPNENEMLLQAGMEYTVLNVRTEGSQLIIRMRVTNWPGKAS